MTVRVNPDPSGPTWLMGGLQAIAAGSSTSLAPRPERPQQTPEEVMAAIDGAARATAASRERMRANLAAGRGPLDAPAPAETGR